MSTVAERTWTPTDDDLGPAQAHYAWATDRTTALCGKRLLGVDAPAAHPRCEECKRIYEGYVGEVRLWGQR